MTLHHMCLAEVPVRPKQGSLESAHLMDVRDDIFRPCIICKSGDASRFRSSISKGHRECLTSR